MATVDLSTPEARRANPKPGLTGNALKEWIKTGKGSREQSAAARAARKPTRKGRRSKGSDADRAIVERAAKLAPKTPTWPKQIQRVRKVLSTFPALATAGMTKKGLRAYAKGEAVDEPLDQLREISHKTADPYCSGRRLAAVLVALEEEASKK